MRIVFAVKDTGIGMTREFLPHVFDPYEQQDASIGTKYGGTGLGLSIVKAMVEMMGGSVAVESVAGSGSTFTVILPFEVASPAQAAALGTEHEHKAEAPTGTISGMNILLAEDNAMNSEIAVHVLEASGATVSVAQDGDVAVKAFEDSKPGAYDAILMDIQMPTMNGYEATRAIRASGHPDAETITIIAMTANAFEEDVKQALEAGMNAHIAKPIDVTLMLETLSKLRR